MGSPSVGARCRCRCMDRSNTAGYKSVAMTALKWLIWVSMNIHTYIHTYIYIYISCPFDVHVDGRIFTLALLSLSSFLSLSSSLSPSPPPSSALLTDAEESHPGVFPSSMIYPTDSYSPPTIIRISIALFISFIGMRNGAIMRGGWGRKE